MSCLTLNSLALLSHHCIDNVKKKNYAFAGLLCAAYMWMDIDMTDVVIDV